MTEADDSTVGDASSAPRLSHASLSVAVAAATASGIPRAASSRGTSAGPSSAPSGGAPNALKSGAASCAQPGIAAASPKSRVRPPPPHRGSSPAPDSSSFDEEPLSKRQRRLLQEKKEVAPHRGPTSSSLSSPAGHKQQPAPKRHPVLVLDSEAESSKRITRSQAKHKTSKNMQTRATNLPPRCQGPNPYKRAAGRGQKPTTESHGSNTNDFEPPKKR
nr:unnamed protein product [Digitaria exilis]